MSDSASEHVWRVAPAGRMAAVGVVCIWLTLAAVVSADGESPSDVALLLWALTGVVALGAWRWAFVPYVALGRDGITVQNRLARTSVPFQDVAAVEPGYSGLQITRRRGDTVTAWAVQKSNVRRMQGRTDTRADDVADAIRRAAGVAR